MNRKEGFFIFVFTFVDLCFCQKPWGITFLHFFFFPFFCPFPSLLYSLFPSSLHFPELLFRPQMAQRTPLLGQAQAQTSATPSPAALRSRTAATTTSQRTTATASTTARPNGSKGPASVSAAQKTATKERAPSIRLAKLLLWVFLVHVGAIYLFTRGFLLSRSVLDSKSECSNTNMDESVFTNHGLSSSDRCWYPQQYKKAVVIVIDALRFE